MTRAARSPCKHKHTHSHMCMVEKVERALRIKNYDTRMWLGGH